MIFHDFRVNSNKDFEIDEKVIIIYFLELKNETIETILKYFRKKVIF